MLKDIRNNPILLTDTYNLSHQNLKVNTDWEVSHIYNRSEGMILYGFAETINPILTTRITMDMVDDAEEYASKMGLNFPRELFDNVVTELNGYMPLLIQSLPEGMWCPTGTPFAQVRNTVKGYGELVTWLEGVMLQSSFPCGTATEALHMRRYLEDLKGEYGDNILIKIHSFGFRGHRSLEDAYWAGTSWNLFLHGTDDFHTMQHTPHAKMGSISALAHKVTQQYDDECEGYIHTIDATVKAGEKIVAIVIDTYDANRFIESYLHPLANYAKEKGVHLVIRPDSGDTWEQAVEVYRKSQQYDISNVSVIIGESMNFHNIKRADRYFKMKGVPLDFISYGVGGGFYNHINRDTLGFAMKTAFSNGKPRMKFGMDEFKRSIPDKVVVFRNEDGLLEVTRERDWLSGADIHSLYDTIYHYDHRHTEPFIVMQHWVNTQSLALQSIEGELQDRIVISDSIKELVKGFEEIYG